MIKNIVPGKRHQTYSSHLTTVTFIEQHARVILKVKQTPLKSLENNISVINGGHVNVKSLHKQKFWNKFKIKPTPSHTVSKQGQHVALNNVGPTCMFASFE